MINIIIRTIFFYFFIVLSYRIMGKREVGQLGIIDLIVSILIAELVAISIENYNDSIFTAVFPIMVLVLLEIVLGFISMKSRKFNKVFEGQPTIIISQGKLQYNNLVSQRYSLDDLLLELRQKGISSLEEVEYAFLETNGKLSIFKYNALKLKKTIPLPVIVEKIIQKETLQELQKNEAWLMDLIKKADVTLEDIFYAFYKENHLYIVTYK